MAPWSRRLQRAWDMRRPRWARCPPGSLDGSQATGDPVAWLLSQLGTQIAYAVRVWLLKLVLLNAAVQ